MEHLAPELKIITRLGAAEQSGTGGGNHFHSQIIELKAVIGDSGHLTSSFFEMAGGAARGMITAAYHIGKGDAGGTIGIEVFRRRGCGGRGFPSSEEGRNCRPYRAQWRGQNDTLQRYRRAAAANRRGNTPQWTGYHAPQTSSADGSRHRAQLSDPQTVRRNDRAREYAHRCAGAKRRAALLQLVHGRTGGKGRARQ